MYLWNISILSLQHHFLDAMCAHVCDKHRVNCLEHKRDMTANKGLIVPLLFICTHLMYIYNGDISIIFCFIVMNTDGC